MNTKTIKTALALIAAFMLLAAFTACNGGTEAAPLSEAPAENILGVLLSHFSPRAGFTTGTIPQEDLDIILYAGIRTGSAGNRQPWFFTVVQDLELAQRVVPQTVQDNIIIVVSTEGTTHREIMDSAMAAQSMYLAAQALGHGSQLYIAPIERVNRELRDELGFPPNRNAVLAVRVGRVADGVDSVSGASPRRDASEIVTFK